jgi:hypothetical protein
MYRACRCFGSLAGAVFIYKQYLQTANNSKKEQLQRAKDAFDPTLIQQLTRLDDRMHAGLHDLGAALVSDGISRCARASDLDHGRINAMTFEDGDLQHINVKLAVLRRA